MVQIRHKCQKAPDASIRSFLAVVFKPQLLYSKTMMQRWLYKKTFGIA